MPVVKKDDGPAGPQGPSGKDGPSGEGNANIQSEIIIVLSSEWEVDREDATTHIGFEYMVNEIYFFFQLDDGMTPEPGERTFKVVGIESRVLEMNPGIQNLDYSEAMELLGVKE